MYIGSIEKGEESILVFRREPKSMVCRKAVISRGLQHIVNEILQNARDHVINDKTCDTIKVWKSEEGKITVENNGTGIPIRKQGDKYIPEIIFGVLLSSSNYNMESQTEEQNIVGGQNGLGAKLTNIFSKYFKVETVYKK